jgi:6-phosphogluconolactonase
MRHALLLCLLLALLLAPALSLASESLIYVSCSDVRRVEVYASDAKGALTPRSRLVLEGKPGPMALSPRGKWIYVAATRRGRGKAVHEVVTLERLAGGKLRVAGKSTVGSRPTYLRVGGAGAFLLSASYGAGDVSVHALTAGLCAQRVDHKLTERTAHCIQLDPSGRFAFVPHTAPNKVYQFRFDPKRGTLSPNEPPAVSGPDTEHAYHQPRHLRFHPTLPLAFTSNERGGGISSWRFDSAKGTLTREQTLSALPPGTTGKSAAAEVRITPNGRFAYVSNRDLDKQGKDTLAGFALDARGKLRALGHFPAPSFPRCFAIDAAGLYLYAAGQVDHRLAVYRIDAKTGKLLPLERLAVGKRPSWVLCVEGS